MNLSDFDYTFPDELVAQAPLPERDQSRMMVLQRQDQGIAHRMITDLPRFLNAGDVFVVNDSKVGAVRLFGTRQSGASVELLVVEKKSSEQWKCLAKRAKHIRPGEKILFGMVAQGEVVGREGIFLIVTFAPGHLQRAMATKGVPPLPPYIHRSGFESYTNIDWERYQTVYAMCEGSAAAPTAGLHFSQMLLEAIRARGVDIVSITLHVGIDTFRPLRVEHLEEHRMHGERLEISETSAHRINQAKKEGGKIIACGTTVVRALESSAKNGQVNAGNSMTHLFIRPGFSFQIVDALLTNFHLPKSTLLMLVAAFANREFLLSCYKQAVAERYRLFSYGDCMFIR